MYHLKIVVCPAHIMPSGGDWTIQRIGAITIRGAENFTIINNVFTRNDGIGIILTCRQYKKLEQMFKVSVFNFVFEKAYFYNVSERYEAKKFLE